MIMASGHQWLIMKMDDQSFSIMEHVAAILNEAVNIHIFCWYGT